MLEPSRTAVRPRESMAGGGRRSGLRARRSRLPPRLVPRARDDGLDSSRTSGVAFRDDSRTSGVAFRDRRGSDASRDTRPA